MKKLLILLLFPLFSIGQKIPERMPNTYVFDYAHKLDSNQIAHLNKRIVDFKAESSIQMAVVVLDDLDGYEVEDFATKLFRTWGIGEKTLNNGVLYLVSPANRKARLEVGYGLEGDLTDADSKEVLVLAREFFKKEDYYTGIERVVSATIAHLKPISWEQRAKLKNAKLAEQKALAVKTADGLLTIGGWAGAFSLLALAIWLGFRIKSGRALRAEERRERRQVCEDAIKIFERIKSKIKPDSIEKEFDGYFARMKDLALPKEDYRKRLHAILRSFREMSGVKYYVSDDKEKINTITKESHNLQNKAQELLSLLSEIKLKVESLEAKNEFVRSFIKRLPTLRKQAEKTISKTPYGQDKLGLSIYATIIGWTGIMYLIYERAKSLEQAYSDIINYESKQEAERKERERVKKERDLYNSPAAVAKREKERLEQEEEERRRRKRREEEEEEDRRRSSSYASSSYDSGSSSSSSSFGFGGGSSGGGGASDSW